MSQALVLVVDNNTDSLYATSQTLQSSGYRVLQAETGPAGLRLAREHQPDLILLNLVQPDGDGVQLSRMIKQDPDLAYIPVLVFSDTQTRIEQQSEAVTEGGDGTIIRPLSNHELVAHVETMLRFTRAEAAQARDELDLRVQARTTELAAANAELEQRAYELSALNTLGYRVSTSLSREQVIKAAVESVAGATAADLTLLFLHQNGRLEFQGAHSLDLQYVYTDPTVQHVGECLCGLAAREGRSIYSSDIHTDWRWSLDECKQVGLHSFAALPLFSESGILGVLGIAWMMERDLSKQASFLEALAGQVAISLQNALLHEQVQSYVAEARQAEAEVRQKTAQMEALRRLGLELAANLELDSLLNAVVRQAAELAGSQSGGIYLYRADQDILECHVSIGDNTVPVGRLVRRGEGLSGRVLESGKLLIIHDYARWEGQLAGHDHRAAGTVIGLPVRWGVEFLGVLNVALKAGRSFSEDDIELLTLFASQSAIAIKNAQLFEQIQRRAQDLEAINQASQAMAARLVVDEVLSILTQNARHLLLADRTSVLLRDGDELVFAAVADSEPSELLGVRLPDSMGIVGTVLREGRPILAAHAQRDPRFDDRLDALTGRITGSLVAVPLMSRGKIWGVVTAAHGTDRAFTQHDLATLQALCNSATAAIENAQLYEAERDQREFAETLREVSSVVVATLDMEAVLDRLLEQMGRVVPNDAANIMLIEDSRVRIVRHRGYERFGTTNLVADLAVPVAALVGTATMVQVAEPILIPDTRFNLGWVQLPDSAWINSYAGAPIRVRGETIGFLNINSTTPGFFNRRHVERLQAFADQVAIAIENARLYRAQHAQYRRLQESQAQLVQAEKMSALGRLTASIAHEINNPLQAVQSCLTLVKEEMDEDGDPQEIQQDLEIATTEVTRVANILKRLRDFYRPAHEGMQPTDLQAVLSDVLELADKQLRRSKVTVERDGAAQLPAIHGNSDHLKQVLLNLILNAIDAMSSQGGKLGVRTAVDKMPGPEGVPVPAVRIEISDTGAGMPPQVLARLFEPFSTTKSEGTGLGLYISYEIIRAHNGQITAMSRMGQGTTFTILLPTAEGPRPQGVGEPVGSEA